MSVLASNQFRKRIAANEERRSFLGRRSQELAPYRQDLYTFLREVKPMGLIDEFAIRDQISALEAKYVREELMEARRINEFTGAYKYDENGNIVTRKIEYTGSPGHKVMEVPEYEDPVSLYDKDYGEWEKGLPKDKAEKLQELKNNLKNALRYNEDYLHAEGRANIAFNKIDEITEIYEKRMAPLLAARVSDIVSGGSRIGLIKAAAKAPFSGTPVTNKEAIAHFSNLKILDFEQAFLDENKLDREIFHQHVAQGVAQSPASIKNAVLNIQDKNNHFVVWDLETFGPNKDLNGRNLGQRITDFSFSVMRGEVGTGRNEVKKTFGSIIGINQKEYDELKTLVEKYTSNQKVTDAERVTLNRLARMGNEKTQINWKEAEKDGRGVFRYLSFAEAGDIGETKEEMMKGLEDLRRIGEIQKATVKKGLLGWENELLSGLKAIVHNDLTAVAHNGAAFDIEHLDKFIHGKNVSDEFKRQANVLLQGRPLSFNHSLDTLAALKSGVKDRQEFFLNFFDGDKEKLTHFNKFLREKSLSQFTQEALSEAYRLKKGISSSLKGAHSAEKDALTLAEILTSGNLFVPGEKGSLVTGQKSGVQKALKANGSEVFYALSSINANSSGIFTFVQDQLTGQYRSSDGLSVSNFGVSEESFGQPGIKRRALYILTGLGEIKSGNKIYDALTKVHPDLSSDSLLYAKLIPLSNSETVAAKSPITLVGTQAQIEKQLNQTFIGAGKILKDGTYSTKQLTKEQKRLLSKVYVDSNGARKVQSATSESLLADSTYAFDNDAPARVAREKSAKKDNKVLQYIKEMDAYVEKEIEKDFEIDESGHLVNKKTGNLHPLNKTRELYRQQFRDSVRHNTQVVAQDRFVKSGVRIKSNNPIGWTYYDFFGWQHNGSEINLYSNTMTNMTQLENYVRKNQDLIEDATAYARKHSGTENFSDPIFQAYYKEARDALETEALLGENSRTSKDISVKKGSLGYQNTGRTMAEMENIFEVDINGFRASHKTGGNIVQFNLGASGIGVVDKIYRAMGVTDSALEKTPDSKKVQLLRDFQEFMSVPGGLKIDSNDSIDSAGSKILSAMRITREKDPLAGWLTPTEQHDILSVEQENLGLSAEKRKKALSVKPSSFMLAPNPFQPPTIDKNGKIVYHKNSNYDTFIEDLASEVNEKILFDKSLRTEEAEFINQMKKFGYSERDTKTLFEIRKAKKEDSFNFLKNLFNMVYSNGGMIGYNEQDGRVFMYDKAAGWRNQEAHELHLVKESFENGSFYAKVGERQTRHIDPLTLDVRKINGQHEFTLASIMSKAGRENRYIAGKIMQEKAADGVLHEGVEYYLKKINAQYQSFATVLGKDAQDAAMSNTVFIGDATKGMSVLANSDALKKASEGPGIAKEVLREMLEKPEQFEKELSSLGYDFESALILHSEALGTAIFENLEGSRKNLFERILPAFSGITAHTDKGYVPALRDANNALELTHHDQPGTERKLKRASLFNMNTMEYIKLKEQGAKAGSALRSTYEQARIEKAGDRLGYKAEDTLIAKRVSATTEGFRSVLAEGTARGYFGREGSYANKLLHSVTTDEGASAITSYMADGVLNHNFYEQHVRVRDVMLANNGDGRSANYHDLVEGRFDDVHPNIEQITDADGNVKQVNYHSGDGVFVRKNEKLFEKYSSFGGGSDPVKAKQTGFLRSGLFQDGNKLTDEAINEIINTKENIRRINAAENKEAEVYKILQSQQGLRHDYYVDELEISGNIKFSDLSEKNTGRVLIAGLGVKDKKTAEYLMKLGAQDLIGREVTADFIEEIMNYGKDKNLARTKLGIAVNALRKEQGLEKLTTQQMLKHMQEVGFENVNAFGEALYRERHHVSDSLNEGLHGLKILAPGEYIQAVVNNFPGQRKHGYNTAVKSMILALQDQGMSSKETTAAMEKVIPGIKYDRGQLIYDGGQINFQEYNKLARDKLGAKGTRFDETSSDLIERYMRPLLDKNENAVLDSKGNHLAVEIAPTEFKRLQNLEELRVSDDGTHTVKIDERVLNNMVSHRYGEEFLSSVENRLENVFGKEAGSKIYEENFQGKKTGDILGESFIRRIQKGMYYTDSEERLFDSFNTDFTFKEHNKAVRKLKDAGMTERQIDAVVRNFTANGATRVSWDKVSDFYTATSHVAAQKFNLRNGKAGKISLDEMQKIGFQIVNIDDLSRDAISALNSGEDGYERFNDSLMGRQIIIDLESKELKKKKAPQIFSTEQNKYVAIPFQPAGRINPDGSTVSSKINQEFARFIYKFEDYKKNYVPLTSSPEAREEKRWNARNAINEVRSAISVETTSKEGVIKDAATVKITSGVAHLSAQGHMMLGNRLEKDTTGKIVDSGVNLDGAFGRFNLFGKNLSELATRNRMIDLGAMTGEKFDLGYAVLGQEVRKNWYNENLFKTLTNGDVSLAKDIQESVTSYLDNGGATLTDMMRHPTQRNRSVGAIATFFDQSIGNDQVTIAIREMLQKKGDFDGDKLADMMLKSQATITWKNGTTVQTDQLDYATYNVLRARDDVKIQLHDDIFKDAKSEILTAAFDYNPVAEPRDPDMKGGSFDVSPQLKEATWDGRHSIDFNRRYSSDEIIKQGNRWKELEQNFNTYLQDKGIKVKTGSSEYLEEMSKYADTLGAGTNDAKDTMHFHAWENAIRSMRNSAMSKQAAGILNSELYDWQRLSTLAGTNLSTGEIDLARSGVAAAQEATLSGKSEHGEIDIRRVNKLRQVQENAFEAMRTGKNREKVAIETENFYRELFQDRANKEFALQPGNEWGAGSQNSWWLSIGGEQIEADIRTANTELGERELNNLIIAEQAARAQGHMVRKIDLKGVSLGALRLGVSKSGFNPDREITTFADSADDSLAWQTNKTINEIGAELGLESNVIRETATPSETVAERMAQNAEALRRDAQKNAAQQSSRVKRIADEAAGRSHSFLGGAIRKIAGVFEQHTNGAAALAIGIAGGILTSGYVSGPTPAQTHAQEQAQDEQEVAAMQQVPSLSDANMNVQRGGPNSGYIININASSQRGQDAAAAAISNAVSGMVPQNGSINLTVNSGPSDQLNQFQINRMVANAIGVAT